MWTWLNEGIGSWFTNISTSIFTIKKIYIYICCISCLHTQWGAVCTDMLMSHAIVSLMCPHYLEGGMLTQWQYTCHLCHKCRESSKQNLSRLINWFKNRIKSVIHHTMTWIQLFYDEHVLIFWIKIRFNLFEWHKFKTIWVIQLSWYCNEEKNLLKYEMIEVVWHNRFLLFKKKKYWINIWKLSRSCGATNIQTDLQMNESWTYNEARALADLF